MEHTVNFLNAVYNNFGVRAIGSLHKKAHELLDTILMGLTIVDYEGNRINDFMLIGVNLARV